jgi:hypothetical protein
MVCLAHNLATQRTEVLKQPVWRYRFDLVESNLNQYGSVVGAFHGAALARTARRPPRLTIVCIQA